MGKRVDCYVEDCRDDDDCEAVMATCSRCEHVTVSRGTTVRSVRRCLALMREECPLGEDNFYADEDDG